MTLSPGLEVELCNSRDELECVVDYFHDASTTDLLKMGVDRARLPPRDEWIARLASEIDLSPRHQSMCYVMWRIDGHLVGHSSMNKIAHGEEGYVHLHLWDTGDRRRGLGTELLRASVSIYLSRFSLKRVISEPFAENPGPNKVLPRIGFGFEKRYRTTPGLINFEQEVNRWRLIAQ